MSFPPYQDKKKPMIPDLDNPQFIPMSMTRDKKSRQWDNSLPKSSLQDHRSPMAWSRLEWLLSAFKANGQKCNMQTIIESTFRGEDLFYTNDNQSQECSRPSSSDSSSSTSSSSSSSFS